MRELNKLIGKTDIYLLDLILSEKIPRDLPILDAGCGRGRNLHIFRQEGWEVFAIDRDAAAVAMARQQDDEGDDDHYQVSQVEDTGFESGTFGLVICNAVLHFAHDEAHFGAMVEELWRLLAPGGIFFCRLASSIGIEDEIRASSGKDDARWHRLPDGSDRFLVDVKFLTMHEKSLGAERLGPIKTIHVQGLRCMTNWVLRKG